MVLSATLTACGQRHDIADMAVGVAPFEQLRGMDMTSLRSGMVRAMRKGAEPSPLEGLRELVGTYDVLYGVTGYDGTDGSWPDEEALVLFIEATREWPTEASAVNAWRTAMRELGAGMGTPASCATIEGQGYSLQVAEWRHRDGWSISTTYAPGDTTVIPTITPRHSITVRRGSLGDELPRPGAPNPEKRATWAPSACGTSTTGAASAAPTDPTTKSKP